MGSKILDRVELKSVESDFLCRFCYEPIYYDIESKKDVCINSKCKNATKELILKNDPNEEDVKPFYDKYDKIKAKCFEFDKEFLYARIYKIRAQTINNFFTNNGIVLQKLLGINLLLTKISSNDSWGSSKDVKNCDNVINECIEQYVELKEIEVIRLGIFRVGKNGTTFEMKYYKIIQDIRKELGIVDGDKHGPEDVNSFYFLDKTARVGKPKGSHDFETLFKNHFNLVITTNHIFKLGYFLSQIHKYPATTSDFAILFALWSECIPGKHYIINKNELEKKFEDILKINKLQGNFDEFIENYSSAKTLAPIIIFDGSNFHYDYGTLFFMLFYIFSLNKGTEGKQTLSGFVTLNQQRSVVAKNFEDLIRDKFRKENFEVYPENDKPLIVKVQGEEHEYDCIAIDQSQKLIILGDAKYEDISPSSISGETILEQTVLDSHDGLLKQSIEQNKRLEFFKKNSKSFPFEINEITTYKIISIIVTKHVTMFHKYKTTEIIPYKVFLERNFR